MRHFREFHQQEENADGKCQKSTNLFSLAQKMNEFCAVNQEIGNLGEAALQEIVNDDGYPQLKRQAAAYELKLRQDENARLTRLEQICIQEKLTDRVDLKGLDPKIAQQLIDPVREAKKDFPKLELAYIGTISGQLMALHTYLEYVFCTSLKKEYGVQFSEAEFEQLAKMSADSFMERYGLEESNDTYAWAICSGGHEELMPFEGIAINSSWGKTFERSLKQDVALGFHPQGCDTIKAVIDHEVAHKIDDAYSMRDDKEIQRLYREMCKIKSGEPVSEYARKNIAEFIAEAYTEYRNNPQPGEYAMKVYQRMCELAKEGKAA